MVGTADTANRWARSTLAAGRMVVGTVLLAGAGVAAVLFVLAAWNPWDLVVPQRRFGNPALGALVLPVAGLVGLWLAVPVRNEAQQRWRIGLRLGAAALVLVGVCAWGVFGNHFRFDVQELARSADGSRTVVMVTDRDTPPNSYLRIYAGSGLGQRDAGELGRVCSVAGLSARFLAEDRIELRTAFGVWPMDLDPATGAPRQVLGPRCPDGPIPATLE